MQHHRRVASTAAVIVRVYLLLSQFSKLKSERNRSLIFRGRYLEGVERKIDEKSISILRYFGMEKNSYTRANCINSGGTLLPLETSFFRKPIPEILRKIGTFRFSDVRLHFFSFYRFYIFPGKMGSIHPFQKTKLSLFSQELRVPDAAE